jgi:hypothetical protein
MSTEGILKQVPRTLALERAAQAELGWLTGTQRSLAREWQHVISDRELLVDELIVLLKAAKRSDINGIAKLIVTKKRTHASLHAYATRHGFRDCAKVG